MVISKMRNVESDKTVVEPLGTIYEASNLVKAFQLRLLMKEREKAMAELVQLDYSIWVLEESFRTANDQLPELGTVVPKGSLSPHGGNPRR